MKLLLLLCIDSHCCYACSAASHQATGNSWRSLWCCRSASGRALTGHNKLDRSISGPLSMGGSGTGGGGGGGGGNKQQQSDDFSADDLAGPTVAAQDEDGLSESEVS